MRAVLPMIALAALLSRPAAADPASVAGVAGAGAGVEAGVARERAVIDSFPSPGALPMGVDWVEPSGVLYHVDEARGRVYSITPEGAATELWSVAGALGLSGDLFMGNGICLVPGGEGTLLISDFGGYEPPYVDMLYRFSLGGELLRSVDVDSICDGVLGVCFDGESYWLSSYVRREIVQCDTAFHVVDAFAHPGGGSGGLDYDPVSGVYYASDFLSGTVYVCDSSMSALAAFGGPQNYLVGVGVGRSARDRSLWCSSFGSGFIYEIEDPYSSPVEPSSWGSIKALFR